MIRFFPVFIIFFAAFTANAQQFIGGALSKEDLHELWSEQNERTGTPVQICLQSEIPYECQKLEAEWLSCSFRPISADEIPMTQFSKIDTYINICVNVVCAQHKSYAELIFSPFRLNNDGNIEVVDSFRISLRPISLRSRGRLLGAANKTNSLLSEGNWFKIKVDTSGVYKLTYNELRDLGVENPENTRVFSYGGKQLSFYNNDSDFDDLNEIPTLKYLGNDGIFNKDDYLVFYAQGPTILDYDADNKILMHKKHDYSDFIYLFLTSDLGAGMSFEEADKVEGVSSVTTSESDSYQYIEKEEIQLVSSGRRWYGNRVHTNMQDSVLFSFSELAKDEAVRCYVAVAGRKSAGSTASFQFSYRKNGLATLNITKNYTSYAYAQYCDKIFEFVPKSPEIYVGYSYVSNNSVSEGYIDKICVMARTKLKYSKNRQLHFRDVRTKEYDNIGFNMAVASGDPTVLDITNPLNPKLIDAKLDNGQLSFIAANDGSVREFVAFESGNLLSPITIGSDVGKVGNQNLHGQTTPVLVIVSDPDFIEAANDLAEMHRNQDGMHVEVVTQQQIFNEFSGGTPDVSAIRNYARMLYRRNDGFKYLLLLGDGTYDNKNILGLGGNHILTYQSELGESGDDTYVSDDFFGLLDDDEGEMYGYLDIGVGRLPANNATEAQQMVDKIKRYTSMKDVGGWRNSVTIISDDADKQADAEFVLDAEKLCETISNVSPEYNISKIYMDAFGRVSGASGDKYPDATEAIKKQFAKGTVIINYIGHGNPRKWTNEGIFQFNDVKALRNIDRLPFVITASCEIGRFDDHNLTSLGEYLLLNANGGAVAALVTTRVVYHPRNHQLCNNFFSQKPDADTRLGDLVLRAKNATGDKNEKNKRNFVLLGDPALKLVHPSSNQAYVTHINGKNVGNTVSDTIHAIDTVTISGYIGDSEGNLLADNGILYPTVFDKATIQTTNGIQYAPIINFETYNNILYRGKTSVTDGYFNFSFIMPKDINYSYGLGKISLYAVIDNEEAAGYSNNLLIGGTPENVTISDFDGPEIELFVNDTFFVEGGITNNNPTVIARIWDASGINTTGNGIGHNITAVIDEDLSTEMILNDLYESDIDSYNSGIVSFNLSDLSEGWHTLTFKAWDIYNNSNEATISFKVADEASSALSRVRCYPNPVSDGVWFVADHNQTYCAIDITIKVYDTAGKKVAQLAAKQEPQLHQPIYWDTRCGGKPLESGLYIYTVDISGANGKSSKSGKMIIVRQ